LVNELRNRHVAPDPDWLLPIVPPAGVGVVTPSCGDRNGLFCIPIRAGVGLRIGGEAQLCFRCGPEGSVYHPARYSIAEGATVDMKYTMAEVRTRADRLPFERGYDPADLTPEVMADFEARMRRAFGLDERTGRR
jgi:hypothetical protein